MSVAHFFPTLKKKNKGENPCTFNNFHSPGKCLKKNNNPISIELPNKYDVLHIAAEGKKQQEKKVESEEKNKAKVVRLRWCDV